jgi:hypothetical protein
VSAPDNTTSSGSGDESRIDLNALIGGHRYYAQEHERRIRWTMNKLHELGAKQVVEVGGHPWVATGSLVDEGFDLQATISAEEITKWPDEIAVSSRQYEIRTERGKVARFLNYSANVERTIFPIEVRPDTVVACEIVEHLVRSPHVMFLNMNRWLGQKGKLLVTTPNGAAFFNPLRSRSLSAPYRCHCYERHSYLFTLSELNELLELCGFRIIEAGYVDVYERRGLTKLYEPAAHLPLPYFRDKFRQVIYCAAEKTHDVAVLERRPSCYAPSLSWEYIVPES